MPFPFPMKIQPIEEPPPEESSVKPVVKSRLKRLFELQFLRNSVVTEKTATAIAAGDAEQEPSSVCLAKMVQNFIEDNSSNEKPFNRCNCFSNSTSDDEFDAYFGKSDLASSAETLEILKSLVVCVSVRERNLLADTAMIIDKNKISKRKDEICRKIVCEGLLAVGYKASICKSQWEKTNTYPAGEYEYIDVIIEGERLIVDIDFRSEFEIARSTKAYKSVLQTLPNIFVGKADRLQKIIAVVSEAAKQSLKKKGMHIPPWRKADYIKAKWLSVSPPQVQPTLVQSEQNDSLTVSNKNNNNNSSDSGDTDGDEEAVFDLSEDDKIDSNVKPKSFRIGATGLASIIDQPPKF